MKQIAIVYSSIHHNNTENIVKSIKGIDIYKINEDSNIDLSKYDLVGFASGIYMGKFHSNIVNFINNNSEDLKDIFLIYTSGSGIKGYGKNFQKELQKIGVNVIDVFSCKGFDTYGFWKIIGGIAKNHPNKKDVENFKLFIKKLQS